MKRNFFFIFVVLVLTTSLMGCNTMKGAGKDVESVGKSIQKTANDND
ncbi:MAG: entericidin A/B family lipoprotein [Elusimicrobia bacterium]|nr:entericidin A/B family lipoprotein [Elusimicrobiota bacterium]